MFTKFLVILVFLVIIVSLGAALVYLLKDRSRSPRTVRALTIRIGLSVALLIFLIAAFYAGWLQPHGIQANNGLSGR